MTTGLLLSDDLIFSSKVTGTARAVGADVAVARTWSRFLTLLGERTPDGLLLDLNHAELNLPELTATLALRDAPPRTLGFGSHVDTLSLKAARAAGIERVMPRSRFVVQLEADLLTWLTIHPERGEANAVHEDAGSGE